MSNLSKEEINGLARKMVAAVLEECLASGWPDNPKCQEILNSLGDSEDNFDSFDDSINNIIDLCWMRSGE